jgi:4-hydroxybenzoate polyprenyltransferase/phosphoserine phosphatase
MAETAQADAGDTAARAPDAAAVPLVVDVDGSLIAGDTLIEAMLRLIAAHPANAAWILVWLAQGRARLKAAVAERVGFDDGDLVFHDAVVAAIRDAQAAGRPVYLASGGSRRHVAAIAEQIGGVTDIYTAGDGSNMTGRAKADCLVAAFGRRGFDYIGNEARDLPVWQEARRAIAVNAGTGLRRRVRAVHGEAAFLDGGDRTAVAYLRAIRPHQWLKNILVFLPLIAAHLSAAPAMLAAAATFLALSLTASGTYIANDLLDLPDDRRHPSKRHRPLASGAVPLQHGLLLAPALVLAGLALATTVGLATLGMVAGYLALTSAYTLFLKRRMFIDVVTLATLYTIRVLAGAVAVGVALSPWFLAFSMFLFLMLAIVKRYQELHSLKDSDVGKASGRNYHVSDLPILAALGGASGFAAVLVLALYLNTPAVDARYSRPEVLWLLCPLLVYWIGRVMMLTNRGFVDDDPIVFAVRDRPSVGVGVLCAGVFLVAL